MALIWFSPSEDQPKVRLAFSEDGGLSFASALRVDEGSAIGRAQMVLLPGHSALAFWLESKSGTTRLVGRRIRDEEGWMQFFKLLTAQDSALSALPVSRVHVAILDGNESEN